MTELSYDWTQKKLADEKKFIPISETLISIIISDYVGRALHAAF